MKKIIVLAIGLVLVGGLVTVVTRVMAGNNLNREKQVGKSSPTPAYSLHTKVERNVLVNLAGIRNFKKLNYQIESADLSPEIIVNGQRVQSVSGKTFLVLNLKIANDNLQGVKINSRDYVRLAAGADEWWAPEISNDPIEIQAISTKLARVGFTVDNNRKDFKIRTGEINGEKEEIEIHFK